MAYQDIIKICDYCKKPFYREHPSQKYCSLYCRFWSKVHISAPDECWEWKASKDTHGYGHLNINHSMVRTHRVAWILTYGDIPHINSYHGVCVLHHCDNPPCCNPNPSHLFLGTPLDNNRDRAQKNRNNSCRGIDSGRSKLTEEDVINIRHLLINGENHRKIANYFDVTKSTITRINLKLSWRHI